MSNLGELRAMVYDRGEPDTDTACMFWDVVRALEAVSLTRRQRKILELLGQGLQPLHIAYCLGISASSVAAHRHRLEKKLENFLNGCRVDTTREGHIG